jgi:hypothetical protein
MATSITLTTNSASTSYSLTTSGRGPAGPPGADGNSADITAEAITDALGYVPADADNLPAVDNAAVNAAIAEDAAASRAALRVTDVLYQSDFGIVAGNSADAVAEANAAAIATAFTASSSTGKPLVLTGEIHVKGEVLLAGQNGTIYGHGAEIIQKDIAHNGLTLSTVTVPYGVRIFGLKITGQGAATHNAAGVYGRRGDLSYLTSDIILRDCYISYFRTGISMANVAKFQTDNVTIAYVRLGMDWDSMQTALCTMTRIVQGDSNASSACWKTRGGNFAIRIIGGEYGGSGFARFAEIADGAQMHFEAVNIEAFSSDQTINISNSGMVSLVDSRIGTNHTATGSVISANVSGTSFLPTIVWRNNLYASAGRLVEIYGTPVRGPKIFGDQIKVTFAATQGGTATQSVLSLPGLITGLNADVPSNASSGNGTMFLISPSTSTVTYTSDAGLDNICYRYFDNRRGATKIGSLSNDALMQVWAVANQIQNTTTAETDLLSYSIPSRYSNSVDDTNYMEAFGTTAANANNKTIKVYLGGTAIIDFGAIAANNESWKLSVTIHRGSGGGGQQKVVAVLQGGTAIGTIVKTSETSPTATAAIAAKITGTGTATGDIIMLGGKAWWMRSPSLLGS